MKKFNILGKKASKYALISALVFSLVTCAVIAFSMGGGCPFLDK